MEGLHPKWKGRAAAFLAGQGVTLFGSTLVQMAIIWFVTLKTSSGAWVTGLTLCSFLPQMAISPVSGAWADRYPRKTLILVADGVIAVATLALALLLPVLRDDAGLLACVLAVSVIRSLGAGVQTPAVNAAIPSLVPGEALMRYNGVNSALQSFVQFAAPAAAGALMATGALENVLFVDVATAAVGMGVLACIALPRAGKATEGAPPSLGSDVRMGLRYAFSHKLLKKLLLSYGAFIFLSVPSGFLSALLISRTFGERYGYLTIAEMAGFLGMTAGGLLLGAWGGLRNRCKTLVAGLGLYAAVCAAMGLMRTFAPYAIAMFALSFAIPVVQTAVTSLIQEKAAPEMQGRVFGLLGMCFSGFLPLGMALFGPLADVVSVQTLMLATGALLLLCAAALWADGGFLRAGLPEEAAPQAEPQAMPAAEQKHAP